MLTRVTLQARSEDGAIVEHAFTRLPIMIGRKVGQGHFDLADRRASKLHASLDAVEGQFVLRDASSTNGTFWHGERLPADAWVPIGTLEGAVEFQIGGTVLTGWAVLEEEVTSVLNPEGPLSGRSTITRARAVPGATQASSVTTVPRAAAISGENPTVASVSAAFDPQGSKGRLAAANEDATNAVLTLERLLRNELEAAPPEHRDALSQELVKSLPEIADSRRLTAVLEEFGANVQDLKDLPDPFYTVALDALQDLTVWYTGEDRRLNGPRAIAEFHYRLRTTLDDLMLGYAQLLAGLARFETEMSLRLTVATTGTPTAADLAAKLLDWQTDNHEARAAVRASYAELMMHQVALLRGVMRGVQSLLDELSPDVIERAAEAESNGQGAGVKRLFGRPDPWATYKRRHRDLADEENERFRILFGAEFVSEYRQFKRESRGDGEPGPDSS